MDPPSPRCHEWPVPRLDTLDTGHGRVGRLDMEGGCRDGEVPPRFPDEEWAEVIELRGPEAETKIGVAPETRCLRDSRTQCSFSRAVTLVFSVFAASGVVALIVLAARGDRWP